MPAHDCRTQRPHMVAYALQHSRLYVFCQQLRPQRSVRLGLPPEKVPLITGRELPCGGFIVGGD